MNESITNLRNWLNSCSFREQVEIDNIGKCAFVVSHEDVTIAYTRQDMHGDHFVNIYSKEHWPKSDYLHQLSEIVESMCIMQRINYMIQFSYN